MKVLLTGASGFIGAALCASLEAQGIIQVIKVLRGGSKNSVNDIIYIENIVDSDWDYIFTNYKVDCVIHLAGLAHTKNVDPEEFFNINTYGTINLAQRAAENGISRFIFVSSIGVNGAFTSSLPFCSDSEPHPHDVYAQSKYDAELGLKKLSDETGLEVVIVRPTLVYGPNAPGNFELLTSLVKVTPCLPFGCINNKRNFISVQNLVDLLITCITHPKAPGGVFLASDGKSISIKDFTNAIAQGLGRNILQLPIPISWLRHAGKLLNKTVMVEQLVGDLAVDSSNLQEVLGWIPPCTMEESMSFLKQE